jgi:DNA-binding NtrC family response regulator
MPKILLVDDNDTLRGALGMKLEELGYEVMQADNGKVALELQQRQPVDVLLTDMIMPEREGLEIIQEFKRSYPEVVTIAMSAGGRLSAKDILKAARQLGASYTLAKPFTPDELAETVAKALGKTAG